MTDPVLTKLTPPFLVPGALTQTRPLEVMVVSQYQHVGVGGAERYISEVCARLEQHNIRAQQLATDLEPARLSPPKRLLTMGFHTAWQREITQLLTASRPDALYVHHTVPGLSDQVLRIAKALQIPVALMYHGDVTGPEIYKRLLGNLYYRSVGHTSLQVPQVIFVNSLSYVQASPYLRQLKTQFVEAPPGVDAAMLRGQRDSSIVRQRQPRRYFLFVGKPQVKSKGLEVLVAAWQRLRHRYPEVDLVVIGGTARPSQNGLHFIGKISTREELAHWYASAEATLLPSTSTAESFGMVLAEALLAGCPIIGSDVGGIPTLISHGRNGYLVPPHDVAALAGAMERSLEQQGALRQVVAQQRQDHATRFSWERTSQIVARYLSQLVAKPGVVRQN